ncbi:excalibur calcium-binding domain-containing protein [Aquimarina sp. RZ0]|uniref:excalibur calcium-binding domain-containing protein n=1 Tax=Aquimarina sp. RZ0 TaxID=2607730 RepID=UPI0011F20416|nr:excalibur calcium-binding domain-containing protein [Aquimarina sp. RZ0]KAA1245875.1 hypothetical protein F0000_09965 [Aquimarina sp. RZ0]
MKNQTLIKPLLILLVLLSISNGCTPPDSSIPVNNNTPSVLCIDTNCSDYSSQQAAQAAYDADPECRNDLDHDNDGIACEHLGTATTDCLTTANCGCSGKRKAACIQDPCCQWKVGEGCMCN